MADKVDSFVLTDSQVKEDLDKIANLDYINNIKTKIDLSVSNDSSLTEEPVKVLQKRDLYA